MLYSWICVCLFGLLAGGRSSEVAVDLTKYGGIIYRGETPVCIGAVVAVALTKVTMVTAAHCVRGASNLRVTLGNGNAQVNHVMVHPFYKPPLIDYDIAVLKMENKGTTTPSAAILTDIENETPGKLIVTNTKTPQTLEGADVTKVERQACQSKHGDKFRVSTKMVCAQSGSEVLGGSPLFRVVTGSKNTTEYLLLGVASYNLNSSFPVIFTNTVNSQIYKFIDQYI